MLISTGLPNFSARFDERSFHASSCLCRFERSIAYTEAMLLIYIDADACPVKEEVYRVAARYTLPVFVVSNNGMRVPTGAGVTAMVLSEGFGTVDDWIAEQAGLGDIVVTADIPLASRCLAKQARVLGPRGVPFTEQDIGASLATRDLMDVLRQTGTMTGGPAPMTPKDRSRFLCQLDEIIKPLP